MIETITVKFVNDKPKFPKYSSGSVKTTDEKWVSIAKDLDIHQFVNGNSYTGEIEINSAGYKTLKTILSSKTEERRSATSAVAQQEEQTYKPRDYDKEARGKTRCVQFEAALMSPSLAGLQLTTVEEILLAATKLADGGVVYTFKEE